MLKACLAFGLVHRSTSAPSGNSNVVGVHDLLRAEDAETTLASWPIAETLVAALREALPRMMKGRRRVVKELVPAPVPVVAAPRPPPPEPNFDAEDDIFADVGEYVPHGTSD